MPSIARTSEKSRTTIRAFHSDVTASSNVTAASLRTTLPSHSPTASLFSQCEEPAWFPPSLAHSPESTSRAIRLQPVLCWVKGRGDERAELSGGDRENLRYSNCCISARLDDTLL